MCLNQNHWIVVGMDSMEEATFQTMKVDSFLNQKSIECLNKYSLNNHLDHLNLIQSFSTVLGIIQQDLSTVLGTIQQDLAAFPLNRT